MRTQAWALGLLLLVICFGVAFGVTRGKEPQIPPDAAEMHCNSGDSSLEV